MSKECIFPLSPKQTGGIYVIQYGYHGVMITDSTVEAAKNTARDYFSGLNPQELDEIDLHPELVKRPDFISGVVEITQLLGTRDAEVTYYEAWDADPHFEQDQVTSLEAQFNL